MHYLLLLLLSAVDGLSSETVEMLGRMAHEISLKHFGNSKCLGVLTEDKNTILDFILPLDLEVLQIQFPVPAMKSARRLSPAEEFEEYAWDRLLLAPMNAGCMAFIVQTSDVNFMVQAFARLAHSPKSVYRANRKYLYLPSKYKPDDAFDMDIKTLFSSRQMDFMPDLVIAKLVIDRKAKGYHRKGLSYHLGNPNIAESLKVELITHSFVGKTPSEPVLLDVWIADVGFVHHSNLYPDKFSNLMGKEIVLTNVFYPPYSFVYLDQDPPLYDGIEFPFMYEWGRRINFTWRTVFRPDDWWGHIWPNGSGTGMSSHISMDLADMAFSSVYLWEYEHYFTDYSTPYFRGALSTVVPKPKLLPGWLVIVYPFAVDMWTAVGISVLITAFILYVTSKSSMKLLGSGRGVLIVNKYSTWVECAFRTVGILVLQVPPDERDYSTPRCVPMRHLVTWLILFYFVVTTAYCGGLASVLTLPRYEPPIETPHDMADHDVLWEGLTECYAFGLKESFDPKMRILAKNFIEESEEYLTKKAETGEIGFGVERLQNGHFALPPFVNERTMQNLRVMKEDYVFSHCVFMLRKGSPFMDRLNSMLSRARDTGLFLYWEDESVRKYVVTTDQLAVMSSRRSVDPGPTKLLLEHVSGSFFILRYGLALSLITFISEFIRYNCRPTQSDVTKEIRPRDRIKY